MRRSQHPGISPRTSGAQGHLRARLPGRPRSQPAGRLTNRLAGLDDRGSLPLALLIVLIGVALAALLIPMVITQNGVTRFDDRRTTSLQSAETGIDVALGLVRSASDGSGTGVVAKLPCGPLSGDATSISTGDYTVSIAYYSSDPTGQSASWLAANKMTCVSGYGVHNLVGGTDNYTPSYVMFTSSGTDGASPIARTLQATYVVQTTNTNISGGVIRIWPPSGATIQYCMDAGTNPTAGTAVVLQPCPTGAQQVPTGQSWSYNTDLSIQLVSTVGNTAVNPNGNGLCLGTSASPTRHSAGDAIRLQQCAASGSATWAQKWSIDDSSHFEGSKTDKSDIDGYCINAASQGAGVPLTLQTCAGGVTDTAQTWIPSPSVGAGAAGSAASQQLVNYFQFGRCLDVTNQSVATTGDAGGVFLILYACKQNPNPAQVAWNQKFSPTAAPDPDGGPSSAQWRTNNGSNYCLTSPGTEGGYVNVLPCGSTGATLTKQTWVTYQTQDGSGNQLAYKTKYTMVDYTGRCMSLGPGTDLYNGQYYKAVVATCDGSAQQKWNAQPNLQTPSLTNLHEITGG
jgi:hypothetical protein